MARSKPFRTATLTPDDLRYDGDRCLGGGVIEHTQPQ
jgi:hypothetical protein